MRAPGFLLYHLRRRAAASCRRNRGRKRRDHIFYSAALAAIDEGRHWNIDRRHRR
jgi:hypothetical protein